MFFFAASSLKCLIKSELDPLLLSLITVKQISADKATVAPQTKTGNDKLHIQGLGRGNNLGGKEQES